MIRLCSLRAAALASVSLLPLAVAAQEAPAGNNEITIGVRGQTQASPIFGRYNGFTGQGAGFLGGLSLDNSDAWNSGSATYSHFQANDLDTTSGKFAPEGSASEQIGQQGVWGINATYDAITYTGQQFYSMFTPAANGTLGLVPGFTPFGGASATKAGPITAINSTGAASAVNPTGQLALEQAATRRDRVGGNGKYIVGDWILSTGFVHEHKSGSILETIYQSASGQAFGMPVDYNTDRFFIQAAYTSARLQATLTYNLSKFENALTSVDAPYVTSFTGGVEAKFPTIFQATSAYSTPPSNVAHYLNGSARYAVADKTHLIGNFRIGVELQNAPLTSGTGIVWPAGSPNAVLLASNPATTGLAARLYGGNLTAQSEPITDLDLRATYSIDGRSAGYNNLIAGASGSRDGAVVQVNGYSLGQQWTKQKEMLQADYRLWSNTKLTLGFTEEEMDRDIAIVSHSTTSNVMAKVATSPVKDLSTTVTYEHSTRSASTQYTLVAPTATTQASVLSPTTLAFGPDAVTAVAIPWYQAAMDGDTIKLRVNYQCSDSLSTALNGKLAIHDYHYPVDIVGQSRDYTGSVGPDLNYVASRALTTHLFYTYEQIYHGDRGASAPYDLNGGYGDSASSTYSTHTVGLSGDWKISDKLKLTTEYTFSYGSIGYDLFDGITTANSGLTTSQIVNIQNLPNVNSSMHSVNIRGEYDLAPNLTLVLGYAYNMFKDVDWSYYTYASVLPTNATGGLQITSGEVNPSYHVNSLYSAVVWKF